MKAYYQLAKPGIIYGNAFAAAAGFLFASAGAVDWTLFFAMLLGLSFIIGSGCVLNNVYDRDIDARMARTKSRAMVTGDIPLRNALAYALALGVVGGVVLALYTTPLAFASALGGFFVYVLLYTPLKSKSAFALFVGAVAGAVPPVVGYAAVTNTFDWYAFWLFAGLYIWQLPHFLAIATYRYAEYRAAGVPLFIRVEPSPVAKRWGRRVFYFSLVVLVAACVALMLHR